MCKCPQCDSSFRKRVPRNLFLKLIPKAKAYKCYKCRAKYLYVPYLIPPVILLKGRKEIREVALTKKLIVD